MKLAPLGITPAGTELTGAAAARVLFDVVSSRLLIDMILSLIVVLGIGGQTDLDVTEY